MSGRGTCASCGVEVSCSRRSDMFPAGRSVCVCVCVMASYEHRLITIDNLLIVPYCSSDHSRLLHMMEEKWIACLSLSYLSVRWASSSMWMASWCVGPPWSQLLGELSGSSWTETTTSYFPLSSSPMQEAARDTTKPSSCLTCWTSR